MKSSVTKAFRKKLNRLPTSVQEQAAKAYQLWCSVPYHNSLQFKRVSQRQLIDQLETIEGIQQGFEELNSGQTPPIRCETLY